MMIRLFRFSRPSQGLEFLKSDYSDKVMHYTVLMMNFGNCQIPIMISLS